MGEAERQTKEAERQAAGSRQRPANWVQQAAAKEAEAGRHGPPLCPKVRAAKEAIN